MTNTADPRKTQYFPKFDWPRLTCPSLRFPVTDEILREVAAAEETVEREIRAACAANPDDIAALILEPIQGEGGDNHFRPELFRRLRALADELEFLLIFDEVQTGVGLTGSMWCWQQMGVEPDMFAFGKKTQVCGFAANHRVDDIPDNVFKVSSRINSTWGGNLVDMIRCARYLQIITEDNLIENARVVGEYLQARLSELAGEFPGVMTNVRGRGLFLAFDLPDKETRDRTLAACLENGMMGLASGANAVRFRPHLILSKDEADEGIRKLRRAIGAVKK
jgi:L-lysine 6-transaminase